MTTRHDGCNVMAERFIRLPEVLAKTGLGKTTIYQKTGNGSFPMLVKLGGSVSVWVESEVDEWICDRIYQRDGYQPVA